MDNRHKHLIRRIIRNRRNVRPRRKGGENKHLKAHFQEGRYFDFDVNLFVKTAHNIENIETNQSKKTNTADEASRDIRVTSSTQFIIRNRGDGYSMTYEITMEVTVI